MDNTTTRHPTFQIDDNEEDDDSLHIDSDGVPNTSTTFQHRPLHFLNSPPPSPRPEGSPHPLAFQPHVPGDGLDFRRPVMASRHERGTQTRSHSNLIDLTSDNDDSSRSLSPPARRRRIDRTGHSTRVDRHRSADRNGGNVVVIESDDDSDDDLFVPEEGWQPRSGNGTNNSASHTVSFGAPLEIDNEVTIQDRPNPRRRPASTTNPPIRGQLPTDPTHRPPVTDEDDVEVTAWNRRPQLPAIEIRSSPRPFVDPYTNLSAARARARADPHDLAIAGYIMRTRPAPENLRRRVRHHFHEANRSTSSVTLNLPGSLDYTQTSFPWPVFGHDGPDVMLEHPGAGHGHAHQGGGVGSAQLEELPPVQDGFTRNPREGDELICPNCEEELLKPEDDEGTVWIVKACGHVYCAKCKSTNTIKTTRKKDAMKPLKKCVVEGCEAKTTGKQMIPLYV